MNGNHNHLPQGRRGCSAAGVVAACWDHGKLTGIGFQDLGAAEQSLRRNSTHAMTRSCEYKGFAEQSRRLNWT
jgi:hypothetical protein